MFLLLRERCETGTNSISSPGVLKEMHSRSNAKQTLLTSSLLQSFGDRALLLELTGGQPVPSKHCFQNFVKTALEGGGGNAMKKRRNKKRGLSFFPLSSIQDETKCVCVGVCVCKVLITACPLFYSHSCRHIKAKQQTCH